jgi:hypothetical protein
MTSTAPRYDRWKAPTEDGQTLIWPAAPQLLADAQENHRRLSSAQSTLLQNVPLPEVRARMRQWLGHEDEQSPLFATGHQAELHHPGVWVKNALIDAAAHKTGGRAVHFAVDTDEPKHLQLRWPGGSIPLTDESHPKAAWSGLLPAPSPAHLDHVSQVFQAAAKQWPFRPLVPDFLRSLRRLSLESPALPSALTNAIHELDWNLGLRHHAMLVSPICLSEPYLVFVHHILARADQFSADYNAALDEFRTENKIRTPGRPMPNLRCVAEGCEVPFWLDDLTTGSRSRAAVARGQGAFVLRLPEGAEFRFDPQADGWEAAGGLMLFLRRHGVRLSPRALSLTAVLRLLAADQFVHGIGGGLYDQVLDKLIARHFGLEPPRFSVTTATLYFPLAVGQPRVCLPCIAQEGHRLKHAMAGGEKAKLVEAIASAPRNSRERSTLFYALHDKLAAAQSRPELKKWEQHFARAQSRVQEEKALFDRELFYALQPADRLKSMIDRYREAFI